MLVVDDSPLLRRRVTAMIRETRSDAVVAEAQNAAEALSLASAQATRLVVLDLGLPDGSGLGLIEPLKQSADPPVVVVLTNHATEHHRRESIARGADYFLDKSREFERVGEIVHLVASRTAP